MPLYSSLASLSQTPASNAADGSVDAPSTIDNNMNLLASFIAQLRDSLGQWVAYSGTPTFISATSFRVTGDQTAVLQVGRRLKTVNTGGTVYSTITASVYSAPNTTVTVANDSGALDAGLSAVSYGLISALDSSISPDGNYAGYKAITANTALTFADAGKYIAINATGLTVTLPLGASVLPGSTYTFQAATSFTLARSGADTIFGPQGSVATQKMYGNTSIVWTGTTWAIELGGDLTTVGVNGREQRASGLVTQWGSSVILLNGSGVGTINFPAPFGTVYTVMVCNGDNAQTVIAPVVNATAPGSFTVLFPAAGAITVRCNWEAKGLAA